MMENTVANSSCNQTYGQADTTYANYRGGVAPVSRSKKPIVKATAQAKQKLGSPPVIEKHNNGDVTFHLQGYPPVTCEKVEGSFDGAESTSYRTKMSDEARAYEDSRRISVVVKQLQKMIAEY